MLKWKGLFVGPLSFCIKSYLKSFVLFSFDFFLDSSSSDDSSKSHKAFLDVCLTGSSFYSYDSSEFSFYWDSIYSS